METTNAVLLIACQLLGAALAALLGAFAIRAHRHVQAPSLIRFGAGFVAIALSQVLAAILEARTSSVPFVPTRGVDAYDALFWGYYGSLLAGLLLILSSFERKKLRIVLAAAPVLLVAGPIAQLGAMVLLFLVVVHAGLNHIEKARAGSILTTIGFFLLLVAHGAFLLDYAPLTPRNVVGEAALLAGLTILCIAAFGRGRPRSDA